MKFIRPSEISARILTLLDESDERVIIVSPYLKISKWYKFINKINGLKARGIILEIYVRDDPENMDTFRDLDILALEFKKIPHLHCKLYMNESCGIVTSMNLLLSSEIHSLEIGYATETWTEYNELLSYYQRYIHTGEPVHCDTIAGRAVADLDEVMHSIRKGIRRTAKDSWLWLSENALHISTGRNNYRISINEGCLRIAAFVRFDSATKQKNTRYLTLIMKKIRDLSNMKVDILPGSRSDILHLSGQAQHTLKSRCMNGILETEAAYMMESVKRFITATEDLVFQEAFNRRSGTSRTV
jgi:hypothetical protein